MKLESILPPNLVKTCNRIKKHYKQNKYKIQEAVSVDSENLYRLHLVCNKKYEKIGIEIRAKCEIVAPLRQFIEGCQARRLPIKLYITVPDILDGEETTVTHIQMNKLKSAGIGLLIVNDSGLREEIGTIPCNRRIALEPGLSLGKYHNSLIQIINKYNLGNCLDAIRDLGEEVEDATTLVCIKAAKRGRINITEAEVTSVSFSWEDKINVLSAPNYRNSPQTRFLDPAYERDLKSFKDVRNLSDHRKTAAQKRQLEQSYPDKMLQGIRLLRELVRIHRGIR